MVNVKMLKIFGIFASHSGAYYIANRQNKIRYQFSVVRALYDIASEFKLPVKVEK